MVARVLRVLLSLLISPLLLVLGCGDGGTALDIEIKRAFESGAVRPALQIEPLTDGHSTFYRLSLVDRTGTLEKIVGSGGGTGDAAGTGLEQGGPIEYRWALDGAIVGSGREIYLAFTASVERRIDVVVSLRGDILETATRMLEPVALQRGAGDTVYLTLPRTESCFAVPGRVTEVREDGSAGEAMAVAGTTSEASVLCASEAGYYHITSRDGGTEYHTNVFVSPVPTYHVDRTDRDWYYTQFRTRTTSNCGPSIVSMGIAWASGRDVPVAKVRSHIGWTGTGAVSMGELKSVFDRYGVESTLHRVERPEEIFSLLDAGGLVGVVYDMAGISYVEDPEENLFGQYYVDAGGHYLMIKGYTLDRGYFVVYDPIPSDWISNSGRYPDGVSMYGRNRYYAVDELFESLRSRQIIEIKR